MSFFSRFFNSSLKQIQLESRFSQNLLRRYPDFKFGMGHISNKMNISEWYLSNFIVASDKVEQMQSESEHLTRSFNSHYSRRIFINCTIFILAIYSYEQLIFKRSPQDWQDSHEPKFDTKLYGDLEEGGDEGGDDD